MLGAYIEGILDPTLSVSAKRVFDETARGERTGFSMYGPYIYRGGQVCDLDGCHTPVQFSIETIGVVKRPKCSLAEITYFDPQTGEIRGWGSAEVMDLEGERYDWSGEFPKKSLSEYVEKKRWLTDEHHPIKAGDCMHAEIIDYNEAAAKGYDVPSYYAAKSDNYASKRIEKRGDEWCVISHTTNKNLGCYPTEPRAKERLRQIEAHKSESQLSSAGEDAGTVTESITPGREGYFMEPTHEDFASLTAAIKGITAGKAEVPQEAAPVVTNEQLLNAIKGMGERFDTGFSAVGDSIVNAIKALTPAEPEQPAPPVPTPPEPEAAKAWIDEAKAAGWTAPQATGDGAPPAAPPAPASKGNTIPVENIVTMSPETFLSLHGNNPGGL